jgi:hypothetical protein
VRPMSGDDDLMGSFFDEIRHIDAADQTENGAVLEEENVAKKPRIALRIEDADVIDTSSNGNARSYPEPIIDSAVEVVSQPFTYTSNPPHNQSVESTVVVSSSGVCSDI